MKRDGETGVFHELNDLKFNSLPRVYSGPLEGGLFVWLPVPECCQPHVDPALLSVA